MQCFSKWCIQSLWIALNYSSETLPCFVWIDSSYSKTPLWLLLQNSVTYFLLQLPKTMPFDFILHVDGNDKLAFELLLKLSETRSESHTPLGSSPQSGQFPFQSWLSVYRFSHRLVFAFHPSIRPCPQNSETLLRSHIINSQTAVKSSEVYLLSHSRLPLQQFMCRDHTRLSHLLWQNMGEWQEASHVTWQLVTRGDIDRS